MPANTYVALDTQTIITATPSVTFSTIPQTYTDLVLVVSGIPSTNVAGQRIRINGDTGTNYSSTLINGDGSSVNTGRYSNNTAFDAMNYQQAVSPNYNSITNFFNYTSTNVYKTVVTRYNGPTFETTASVNLWRNTAAITSVTVLLANGNLAAGTTVSLYGVAAQPVAVAKATGGTISYGADGYTYHTFASSGTFTPSENLTCDYLVIGGGGGGGGWLGGGGGAGGLRSTVGATGGGGTLESALALLSGTGYTVTIGAGGSGGPYSTPSQGTNGSNSVFSTITSTGGGGGGGFGATTSIVTNGSVGGSGGGAGGANSTTVGGAGTSNQGYAGGNANASSYGGGGGGGAGVIGGTTAGNIGGVGGAGVVLTQFANVTGSGASTYYAGGGGGHGNSGGGAGGAGGGGAGAVASNAGTAGTGNTGGGGGGGRDNTGGAGGSGLVIVRYAS